MSIIKMERHQLNVLVRMLWEKYTNMLFSRNILQQQRCVFRHSAIHRINTKKYWVAQLK